MDLRPCRLALLTCLLLVSSVVWPAGCGDDEDVPPATATEAATTSKTSTADDDGPGAAEVNHYVEQVRELVRVGDQLNNDYRLLVDRYNLKELEDTEVIERARSNSLAYEDMSASLEGMDVPEGFEDAHESIVSGFTKWKQMYDLDARGLSEKDSALLDQARALDQEAVAEVNDGIDEINRLKV